MYALEFKIIISCLVGSINRLIAEKIIIIIIIYLIIIIIIINTIVTKWNIGRTK